MKDKKDHIREHIRNNCANIAKEIQGCCEGSSCCSNAQQDIETISQSIGYDESDIFGVPTGSNMGLGCGNPIAIASLKDENTLL